MFRNQLIYLFASLLFFSACKKDDTIVPSTETVNLSALVDGVNWKADAATMSATISSGLINISGISVDNQAITITLDTETVGTFSLAQGHKHAVVYIENHNGSDPAFTSNAIDNNIGRVVITKIDADASIMSGTFSGQVLRSIDNKRIEISKGQFTNIPFTTEVIPVEEDFYLKAEIDGTEWKAPSVTGSTLIENLSITAISAITYKSITINFPMNIEVGTYEMGDAWSKYGAQYNANQSTYLMAESGTLEITSHNIEKKEITGVFNFEAEQFGGGSMTASVKNGSFRVTYKE